MAPSITEIEWPDGLRGPRELTLPTGESVTVVPAMDYGRVAAAEEEAVGHLARWLVETVFTGTVSAMQEAGDELTEKAQDAARAILAGKANAL